MSVGSFVFMLHSHLPFYRKAGMWPHGEESVFECMAETYIPLLNAIDELKQEGINANLTIGITPILAEQLADPHMQEGFVDYAKRKISSSNSDEAKFNPRGELPNAEMLQLARYYRDWYSEALESFTNKWSKDILGAFKKFQDEGVIELTTSCATPCLTPLLDQDASVRLQVETGIKTHEKHFGIKPKGFWLPECAYRPAEKNRPGLGHWLHEAGIKYFFTESFVVKGGETAEQRRVFGPYGSIDYVPAPKRPETGHDTYEAFWLKDYPVALMGRHEELGYQVWSQEHGYPGDGYYREFHKKDDLSGLNYWRLTSKETGLGEKHLYVPEAAKDRIKENSDHYVGLIQKHLHEQFKQHGKPGLLMVAFDTELFGHWWFEGVEFIKQVIRKLNKYTKIAVLTASQYLEENPPKHAMELPPSSWGSGGEWDVWLNDDTKWMWEVIHKAEKKLIELAPQASKNELLEPVLKQATRELLLLQSSDWPFLITTGQAKQYAIERFKGHEDNFNRLCEMITQNSVKEDDLKKIESKDNCFAELELTLLEADKSNVTARTK